MPQIAVNLQPYFFIFFLKRVLGTYQILRDLPCNKKRTESEKTMETRNVIVNSKEKQEEASLELWPIITGLFMKTANR